VDIGEYIIDLFGQKQVHKEDNDRQQPIRRVHAETVNEYNTSNRFTDLLPPPFKSITEPVGNNGELIAYLYSKSGGFPALDIN